MKLKKLLFPLFLGILLTTNAFCQAPNQTVTWQTSVRHIENNIYELTAVGEIVKDWHIYGLTSENTPTNLNIEDNDNIQSFGKAQIKEKAELINNEACYFDKITISRRFKLLKNTNSVKAILSWQGCNDEYCAIPEELEVETNFKPSKNSSEIQSSKDFSEIKQGQAGIKAQTSTTNSLWSLILEAILWGFAMLLTPCVFPMVPMTISFFIKGSENKVKGKINASLYGFFIILLYTLPISIIIALTTILGGETVTADIFNWLATHWLPNIIFFVVFMIFAASFFGAFEITLPSSWVNATDKNSNKQGIAGIFFMALTLVLVSFSCTGPIVGTVLIKSTQGEFWAPMVTMLAFSVAFALPFTILALFPSLLKNLPKSGGWLNSVKVVLGFIELALGLKFLSTADQTYHWGILDREIYLAIWIVIFSLLGLYLLGKLHFAHDSKQEHLGVGRLFLSIIVFSFVIYLIPGLWGAPLKGISGYLPPISTQDFIVLNQDSDISFNSSSKNKEIIGAKTIKIASNLEAYTSIEEGIKAARKNNKPIFVDITGHGCVNCREMEQRVWSDKQVLSTLKDKYIIVALYLDDKQKLEEKDWLTTKNGTVLKDVGRVNSYIVRTKFNVNAQPNYVILNKDGKQVLPVRGYNLNIEEYLDFLNQGISLSQ